jgi:hypothetical protein
MPTPLRTARLLSLTLVLASALPDLGFAQWLIGLEVGSERYWGGSVENTPDQRSFRPYRPTTFGVALERRGRSVGGALRLHYADASMALEGDDAVVAVKDVFSVIGAAVELSYRVATLGQNEVLLHAGPLVERWSLIDEESRVRVGAQGAVSLNIPLGSRVALALLANAAVVGSPFEEDELNFEYDLRPLWRRGLVAGLRYRL